ncbi:MAG: GTP 3',8-cyclase MoaA [Pseudomonadota bacterium]
MNSITKVSYLRLSVTDRCNMRCFYCTAADRPRPLTHKDILRYEEALLVVKAGVKLGINKVRVTGGEPLIRKGVVNFIKKLTAIPGIDNVGITTNGVLLKDMSVPLADSGIQRINVSLDTLKPDRFFKITGRDYFDMVWEGISAAHKAGLSPIKLNMVVIKGVNDDEVLDFAKLTIDAPYVVRFIEFMPTGKVGSWTSDKVVSCDEIMSRLISIGQIEPIAQAEGDGPAIRYRFHGAQGEIGFIAPISKGFCAKCNRLRLTADGRLLPCLFSDQEFDLKTLLRSGSDENALLSLMRNAIAAKPHQNKALIINGSGSRQMVQIGG